MQVALIEQGVAPGGGAWLGGQLFSGMVVSSGPDLSSLACLPPYPHCHGSDRLLSL